MIFWFSKEDSDDDITSLGAKKVGLQPKDKTPRDFFLARWVGERNGSAEDHEVEAEKGAVVIHQLLGSHPGRSGVPESEDRDHPEPLLPVPVVPAAPAAVPAPLPEPEHLQW